MTHRTIINNWTEVFFLLSYDHVFVEDIFFMIKNTKRLSTVILKSKNVSERHQKERWGGLELQKRGQYLHFHVAEILLCPPVILHSTSDNNFLISLWEETNFPNSKSKWFW